MSHNPRFEYLHQQMMERQEAQQNRTGQLCSTAMILWLILSTSLIVYIGGSIVINPAILFIPYIALIWYIGKRLDEVRAKQKDIHSLEEQELVEEWNMVRSTGISCHLTS